MFILSLVTLFSKSANLLFLVENLKKKRYNTISYIGDVSDVLLYNVYVH